MDGLNIALPVHALGAMVATPCRLAAHFDDKATTAVHHAAVWLGLFAVVAGRWNWPILRDQRVPALEVRGRGTGDDGHTGRWLPFPRPHHNAGRHDDSMMRPTVLPSTAFYSLLAARRNAANSHRIPALCEIGCAACWILPALPAAPLQVGLVNSSLLNAMAKSTSTLLSAAILLAAGLCQFSSLNNARPPHKMQHPTRLLHHALAHGIQ